MAELLQLKRELENEKRTVSELEASSSHFQQLHSEALHEMKTMHTNYESTRLEQEATIASLTDQLTETVKEKEAGEGKLREMGMQLHSNELEVDKLSSTIEYLRTQVEGHHKQRVVSCCIIYTPNILQAHNTLI